MKKLISGLMSACVAVSSAIALTTSSAFNPNKDPNGDGHLTIADSTAILQYLGGYYEPDDLTELDMDDNDVVSVVDSNYVKMYDAGLINTSIEETAELMDDTVTKTPRVYAAYDAQNGTWLRNYSLRVIESTDTTNTRQIIGENDQVPDWSNRGVAKIRCYEVTSTGFVVGPHTIATAAHAVFNTTSDSAYEMIDVLLFNENGEKQTFTPVEYHIPTLYEGLTSYHTDYDYALITVKEDLSNYMSFNLGAITDNAASNNLHISTVGFPGYVNGSVHTEMLSEGSIINVQNINIGEYSFSHTADTSQGNSGSPIYTTETLNGITYNTVVGINVASPHNYTTFNVGVRFTAHTLKFLTANPNINY